jgi:hypothetical protein
VERDRVQHGIASLTSERSGYDSDVHEREALGHGREAIYDAAAEVRSPGASGAPGGEAQSEGGSCQAEAEGEGEMSEGQGYVLIAAVLTVALAIDDGWGTVISFVAILAGLILYLLASQWWSRRK